MSETLEKPRIGIIGTGAIGGFYGLMLARAGFDVHFLLRSEFSAVSQHGLRIDSQVHGLLTLENVQAYSSAADMPACDWLLVGAKTTGNNGVAPAIAQAAAPGAKVLMLQNGLGVEDELRALLPDSLHLLGGLCFICVHRTGTGLPVGDAGHAHQTAHCLYQKVIAGQGRIGAGLPEPGDRTIDQSGMGPAKAVGIEPVFCQAAGLEILDHHVTRARQFADDLLTP